MLELGREQSSPRLVPLVDLMALNSRRPTTERIAKPEKGPGLDGGRVEAANEKTLSTESLPLGGVVVSAVQPTVKPELSTGPVLPAAPNLPEVNQLVWGRWAWASAVEGDALSKSIAVAQLNGRQATVGNGSFSLYRDVPANGAMELATKEATASFRLAGSSAQLITTSGASELAKVDSGSLNLDFNRRTFATQLAVSNPSIGSTQIVAAGSVGSDGTFYAQSGNAQLAGASSLDAKEAWGYLFEKGHSRRGAARHHPVGAVIGPELVAPAWSARRPSF